MTLNEFYKLYAGKKKKLFVMSDSNEDALTECEETESQEIFDSIGQSPHFCIQIEDVLYAPLFYLGQWYSEAQVIRFFTCDDGIIVLVDMDEIKELRAKYYVKAE